MSEEEDLKIHVRAILKAIKDNPIGKAETSPSPEQETLTPVEQLFKEYGYEPELEKAEAEPQSQQEVVEKMFEKAKKGNL